MIKRTAASLRDPSKAPARRPPAKSMLETVSIFELIMPWKADLPKLATLNQKVAGKKGALAQPPSTVTQPSLASFLQKPGKGQGPKDPSR